MADYWAKFTQARTTRRRVLAMGAAGAGMALLGCSSGDEGGGGTGGGSVTGDLVTTIANSTDQAVPGGRFVHDRADVSTLDPVRDGLRGTNQPYGMVYSRMVKYKTGTLSQRPAGEVEGDAAESWEDTPDGLTYTFKLRRGMKFDRRPPTNSREFTSADAKYSWEKYVAVSPSGGELANSISKAAPVLSFETPDAYTVTMKLAFPFAGFLPTLAYHRNLYMVPVEAESQFDMAREMRGTGPWMLQSYTPAVAYEFVKNPDFYEKGRPFLNEVRSPIIPPGEYATAIANLQAGNLDLYGQGFNTETGVRPEDVVSIKKNQPRLVMFSAGYNSNPPTLLIFSQRPNNPFLDERVRHAASMLLERELWAETFYNIAGFRKDGLEVSWAPNTAYSAGQTKYWVDPRSSEFGSAGKYFEYNPEEAKKLLRAAGHNGPIKSVLQVQTGDRVRYAEVMSGMLSSDNDFQFDLKVLTRDENNVIHVAKGDFEGTSIQPPGSGGDIDTYFSGRYMEGASAFTLWNKSPYQRLNELLVQQRQELDEKKRAELIRGPIQKEFAERMPVLTYATSGARLNLIQPWIRNFGAIVGASSNDGYEVYPHLWYDASKA